MTKAKGKNLGKKTLVEAEDSRKDWEDTTITGGKQQKDK